MKKKIVMITKVFPGGGFRISAVPLPNNSDFLSSLVKDLNRQIEKGILYSYYVDVAE